MPELMDVPQQQQEASRLEEVVQQRREVTEALT
jgi:hypothetical protein